MLVAVIIGCYLLGCLYAYRNIRAIIRYKRGEDWLLLEKIVSITISLFSWGMVIGIIVLFFLNSFNKIDLDKKCKW